MFNKFLFRKSRRLWDIVKKKYCKTGQAADLQMANAHFKLNTQCYKHTLIKCKNYCISTATNVERTCLSVTLHVHCLLCSNEIPTNNWLLISATQKDWKIKLHFIIINPLFEKKNETCSTQPYNMNFYLNPVTAVETERQKCRWSLNHAFTCSKRKKPKILLEQYSAV
jgi:hypothetical protein